MAMPIIIGFREKQIIAQEYRMHRALRKIGQEELAKSSNVTRNTINRIESAETNPCIETLVLIAKALNCRLNISLTKNEENG